MGIELHIFMLTSFDPAWLLLKKLFWTYVLPIKQKQIAVKYVKNERTIGDKVVNNFLK